MDMDVTPAGKSNEERDEQFSNAQASMVFKLLGILMETREVQPENALFPMLVTPSGRDTEASALQPENARVGIIVTLPRITTD